MAKMKVYFTFFLMKSCPLSIQVFKFFSKHAGCVCGIVVRFKSTFYITFYVNTYKLMSIYLPNFLEIPLFIKIICLKAVTNRLRSFCRRASRVYRKRNKFLKKICNFFSVVLSYCTIWKARFVKKFWKHCEVQDKPVYLLSSITLRMKFVRNMFTNRKKILWKL